VYLLVNGILKCHTFGG